MPLPPPIRKLTTGPTARWAWRAVLAVLLGAVAWLAWTPDTQPLPTTGWDKANHLLAFIALAVAGRFGFPGQGPRLLAPAAALLAFGALIEVVQTGVPGRSAEWADLLADLAGIAAGTLLATLALRNAASTTNETNDAGG